MVVFYFLLSFRLHTQPEWSLESLSDHVALPSALWQRVPVLAGQESSETCAPLTPGALTLLGLTALPCSGPSGLLSILSVPCISLPRGFTQALLEGVPLPSFSFVNSYLDSWLTCHFLRIVFPKCPLW